jgi:hypothetical protein
VFNSTIKPIPVSDNKSIKAQVMGSLNQQLRPINPVMGGKA